LRFILLNANKHNIQMRKQNITIIGMPISQWLVQAALQSASDSQRKNKCKKRKKLIVTG
jgi:aspartate/methionine/tyrosine aminotransferase